MRGQSPANAADWKNEQLTDTARLELLDSLISKVYWTEQPDSSLARIDDMLALAHAGERERYSHRALRLRGKLFSKIGNYLAAIPVQEELIAAYPRADYDSVELYRALALAHSELAYALRKTGQSARSLQNYEVAIRYAEAIGAAGHERLALTLNSLGNFYLNHEEYDLAEEKYLASLELHEALGKRTGIYSNLNNLGLLYAERNDYAKALEYYETSLEMKKAAGDEARMSNTYGSIGDVYLTWGREDDAKAYYLEALRLQEKLNLRNETARSLTQLGELALLRGKPAEAVEWCGRSCVIAEEGQFWEAALDCNRCLYQAHKALDNYALALSAHEAYTTIEDSIFNESNAREIAGLEARLRYEEQLATAEREQTALKTQAEREHFLRWILLGAVLALAVLTALSLYVIQLREKQARSLRETAEVKNRFFTNISHELRTPLTLVIGPLEQLTRRTEELPDKVVATLAGVKSNAGKLLRLVEELLELSRLEAGTMRAEQNTLKVSPFLRQIFERYRSLAEEKGIDYQFIIIDDVDADVQTDAGRLRKIVDNLLGNALKFTPEGGQVRLEVKMDNEETPTLWISVLDNGPGIREEDLGKIFNRYYQAPRQGKDTVEGTGIGLALAQESAKLLGGRISVESTVSKGSVFTVKLPIRPVEIAADRVVTAELSQDVSSRTEPTKPGRAVVGGRILIVEDHSELRHFIREVLHDYDCTTADNGQEALRLLKEAHTKELPFDLVVTDLMMPKMDGSTLIRIVKQSEALAPTRFVVLTARHGVAEKLSLLRIGVDDYLTKPFLPEELSARVRNLLSYPLLNDAREPAEPTESSQTATWLKKVEKLVVEQIQSQRELTVGGVASSLNLSNRQLLRKIKAATGLSTQLYFQECKLQLARQYLESQTVTTIAEVSRACGFSRPDYFSKVFQQRFGKAPGAYLE